MAQYNPNNAMSEHPSRFTRFWHELKRRNVIRVMAMYAGTAYVIMEGSDIILPRLGLPDWTVTLVIVLLLTGLPVTLILSWIFDVTPEGLKKTTPEEEVPEAGKDGNSNRRRLKTSDVIIALLFVAVCILLYPKIFGRDQFKKVRDADGRISVMVLPFENMTGDTLMNIWQDGIQDGIITGLSESKELSVRPYQSVQSVISAYKQVNRASLSPAAIREISGRLQTSTYVKGSILEAGKRIRVNSALVNAETEEIIKTFRVEGNSEDDLLILIDSLSMMYRNYLEIKVLEDDKMVIGFLQLIQTNSSEAFRNLIKGRELFMVNEYEQAIHYLDRALGLDSTFAGARFQRAFAYHNLGENAEWAGNILEGRELHQRALHDLEILESGIDQMPFLSQCMVRYLRSDYDKDPWEGIRQMEFYLEEIPITAGWWQLGINYARVGQNERAIECYEKALEIEQRLQTGMKWVYLYTGPAGIYHQLGNHVREKEICEMGLTAIPDHEAIIYRQAVCAYARNDTLPAREYAERYRSIQRESGTGESWIRFGMGYIYRDAGWQDSAIAVFRQVSAQYPRHAGSKDILGNELIRTGVDVAGGVVLCSEAVQMEPLNWDYQVDLGEGYFRLDSLDRACAILQKAWDERTFFDLNHYRLLNEVKEALETRGSAGE